MIVLNPEYSHLMSEVKAVPERFLNDGKLIYERKSQQVRLMSFGNGVNVCVKRFPMPQFHNRIVYTTGLRKPKSLRSYLHCMELQKRNIETPTPIAYIDERYMGLVGYSYYICEICPYPNDMYQFGNAKEGEYEEMAVALARWTAKMHCAGVMHHDYSPNNILWEKDAKGEYHFSLLDTGRMFFGEVSVEKGCANFAKLWGPKRYFVLLAREYAKYREANPDYCERLVLAARRRFWTHYDKRDQVPYTIEL